MESRGLCSFENLLPEQDPEVSRAILRMNIKEPDRSKARQLAREHLDRGDALGWFEVLYAAAKGGPSVIPWADMAPNPNLVRWRQELSVSWWLKAVLRTQE